MGPLARALAFSWAFAEATSDTVGPFAGGAVLRSPSMPDAWSANCLRFEDPDPALTLDAVARLSAEHVGTPYVHANVEDEATALRLLGAADAAGWKTEREVVMLLGAAPAPPDARVRPGTLDEQRALMRAWLTEEGQGPSELESLMRRIDREHAVLPETVFVAEHDGQVAAMATVRYATDGAVANVEDVYALPAARGTGLGRAVTAAAARQAADRGTDVVFIVADDAGWPKELYARLGFEAAARRAQLHRA